jgi:hypothetical protein
MRCVNVCHDAKLDIGACTDYKISSSACSLGSARAQKNRWEEELLLVQYEMQWTTRGFLHRSQEWDNIYQVLNANSGPKAYAARQSSQWRYMALEADQLF